MTWPGTPSVVSRLSAWCRKLLAACRASELKSGVGYRVKRTASGTTIELDRNVGRRVYVKCCLEDNTTAYLPVLIVGDAYTTNGGTTTPLVVTEGDVPDGAVVVE